MGFFGTVGDTVGIFFVMCMDPVKRMALCCIPKSRKSIKGEIVLVTGAGRGLGKAMAMQLAELDPTLILWDINEEECSAAAEQIRQAGHTAHSYRVDVTNQDEVLQAANRVRQEVGDVTILINNAGVFTGQPLIDLQANAIRQCFEVNVLAHFWILQQFLPRMMEMKKGHIVSIASMAGHVGWANTTAYCASKHAAVGLMESLQMELRAAKKKDIKLTTVNPIFITTGLVANLKTRFPTLVPLLNAEEVAQVIIDSVLREEEEVFIPKRSGIFLPMLNCFSRKTRGKIFDYMGYGFDLENSENRPAES